MWYNKRFSLLRAQNSEGFQQSSPYVLKQGAYIYDDFYVQIYDEIMQPMLRADDFLKPVLTATMPSHLHSLFLDIGCGTGAILRSIGRSGYRAIGVDTSPAMISECLNSMDAGTIDAQVGDALDPMIFDRRIFSHILLVDQVMYEWTLDEKRRILQNCSHWLKKGGYLVLHLVDPLHYTSHNKTIREFGGFTYTSKYDAGYSDNACDACDADIDGYEMIHTETFTDHSSQHVRSNENVLYVSPVGDILKLAEKIGFQLQAKWVMSFDKHQYVYLLSL